MTKIVMIKEEKNVVFRNKVCYNGDILYIRGLFQ